MPINNKFNCKKFNLKKKLFIFSCYFSIANEKNLKIQFDFFIKSETVTT